MKFITIAYFVISGLVLGWKGAGVIVSGGHLGQPVGPWLYEEKISASLKGDLEKAKTFQEGLRDFDAHLKKVKAAGYQGGLLLCAFGALHVFIGALLLFGILMKKKEPNQPVQRNASTGSVSNLKSPARRG